MYDVIVIGAGPAGSTAAKILAEQGCRVLMAEKFKMPRYKSCSGQLIRKTLDLTQAYFGEAVPEETMCAPAQNRGMILTDGSGRLHRFEQEGRNVWRSAFDHWLAQKAAQCGAHIRDGTTVLSCEDTGDMVSVTLREKEVYTEQAHYVLDCEGVAGAIKKTLFSAAPQYITTFQTFHRASVDLDPHYFHAYLQPEYSEYDAWCNKKDDFWVLGVAVKERKNTELYYRRFLSYLQEHHGLHIDQPARTDAWLMPRIRPGCPIDYGVGRILFAGEIAGFLNPMGEGISAAMESGYHAACAVAGAFDHPRQVLAAYRQNTKALHWYMQRQWNFTASLASTFEEMKL